MTADRIRELRELWKAGFASASPRVQAVYDAFPEALTALRGVTAQNEALREVAEVVKRIPPAVNLSGMIEVRAWARDLIQAASVALEVP